MLQNGKCDKTVHVTKWYVLQNGTVTKQYVLQQNGIRYKTVRVTTKWYMLQNSKFLILYYECPYSWVIWAFVSS
jgi:hypothetical protein